MTGEHGEKTCPSATLSTINPTRTDPGFRGKRPAVSVSYITVLTRGGGGEWANSRVSTRLFGPGP
jgi:hypothetical protein